MITTAGLFAPLPYPIAWNASDRSSIQVISVTCGFSAAAATSGDDRDPGAVQKYCKPTRPIIFWSKSYRFTLNDYFQDFLEMSVPMRKDSIHVYVCLRPLSTLSETLDI